MDDFSRLEAKLAKLRQRASAPGESRTIRGTPERLLAAVVSQIDETILPRELGFTQGDTSIFIAVANRRLQALAAASALRDAAAGLVGKAIADAEDPALGQLRDVLIGLLAAGDVWTISSRRQSGDGFPSDIGVPSGPLARAWQIAASGAGRENPDAELADYLKSLGARATAWLLIEGEEVKDQSGPEDIVAGLSNKAALFLDGYFSKKDMLFQGETGPSGLVFAGDIDGAAVLFVECETSMAFVMTNAADVATLARDWQARVVL